MNEWRPIRDPDELGSLTASELFQRLLPLLRHGNLLSNPQRRERICLNLASVCFELAADWKRSPTLSGRRVGFADYFAARLCSCVRELDQEQCPELYDEHRRFCPEAAPAPLEEQPIQARVDRAAVGSWAAWQAHGAAATSGCDRLEQTLRAQNVPVASQTAVLETFAGLAAGSITSPYRFSCSLGRTSLEARNRPATAAYIQALELIDPLPVASSR
jgi:hypothetical protein